MSHPGYGFGRTVAAGYAEVVGRVREALKQEGFGIITEIDVAATMKEKLDRVIRVMLIRCWRPTQSSACSCPVTSSSTRPPTARASAL